MADRGGKRLGAGRKPSTLKGIDQRLPKESSALILAEINGNQRWVDLANSEDERIVLETLKCLSDRAYGKARQAIEANVDGQWPIQIISTIPRPQYEGEGRN